ncbi:MAG: type II secretion system GspH family protein [Gammaproteobacteria bacterium]|nr:type II secretion system GspH family protein [Gammaproteobacteria bacterium]MBU1646979.1 type II secretion system GspH family protein [Gammaproteobacteria bacterium]MBU1972491.1 type II secretion system GspH family protein [Gammaproteobacteria bacterium]
MPPAVPPAPSFSQRGFTLTELAVVLVIVALLIGGMLIPLSAQQEIRARADSERILSNIREALIGFAAANGRLPRPATSAADGTENAATCATEAACSGFVPWVTLGTEKLDGWEKIIRYSVTPAYANGPITLASVSNRTVQTRDGVGAAIDLAVQVPAVIFSQGKDRWGTTDSGTVLADGSATNLDEDANNAGPTSYFSRQPSDNPATAGGEFDDIVTWISPNILFNRLISAGRLP